MIQEINFRGTTAYGSGDSADAYVQNTAAGSNNYPTTTPQGVTVGWDTGLSIEHRDVPHGVTPDIRLLGLAASSPGSGQGEYRVDLPSTGTYRIRLAMGDDDNTRPNQKCEIFDNTTSKGVAIATGSSNHFWRDATDVEYNAANWVTSNSPVDITFSSTIAKFLFGDGTNNWAVAHIRIESVSGGPPATNTGDGLKLNAWARKANSRGYSTDLIRKQTRSRSTDQTALTVFGDWFGFTIATAGPAYSATARGGGLAAGTETTARTDTGATRATGTATAAQTTARIAAATSTGTGRATGTAAKSVAWAATGTATGKAATTESKGASASIIARGTGVGSVAGLHGGASSGTTTGTGTASDSYTVASIRASSATATGGGAAAGSGLHATAQSGTVKAGGRAAATEATARAGAAVSTLAGRVADTETTARAGAGTIKAAGLVADSYSVAFIRATFGTATGGGRANASGLHAAALQTLARAGGRATVAALHSVALGAIVKSAGTVATVGVKGAAWSGSVRGGGFGADSYLINHIEYGRAPVGGRAFRPHGAETERPAVISGNRPGNINTSRPANRGGRRT